MKEDERSIARGKRRFHPTENGLEADNSLKCENKTKKSKDSCSSNSESSSLSYNLHDLKINTKPSNVTPLNLALKLPDGTRKIIELTSESTVRDLRRIIKSLNLKDVEVHITPRDPSILFHIWSTKLIDIGLHNNTLLYINQIHSD
ncbi:hypothetical protein HZS_3598 [Henneguya salminicola]|nr:hypothetical protein HZS_3598 [Henneguya salminicola]